MMFCPKTHSHIKQPSMTAELKPLK